MHAKQQTSWTGTAADNHQHHVVTPLGISLAFIAIIRTCIPATNRGVVGAEPTLFRAAGVLATLICESLTYVNSSGLAICHLPPFYILLPYAIFLSSYILLSYAIFTAFLHIEVYWAYWPQTRLFLAVIQ